MSDKDVSLAHLKALLEHGSSVADASGYRCFWCHGRLMDFSPDGGQAVHKPDCVYTAAQEHIARVTDATHSVQQGQATSQVRYSDPVDRWLKD